MTRSVADRLFLTSLFIIASVAFLYFVVVKPQRVAEAACKQKGGVYVSREMLCLSRGAVQR